MSRRRGRQLRPSTLALDANAIDHHILPYAGDWIVANVSKGDVDDLIETWLEEINPRTGKLYSVNTIQNWLKTFKLFFRFACDDIGIRSVADDVEGVPSKPGERIALNFDEMRALLDAFEEKYPLFYPMVLLGFATGQRFGTLSALRWSDIDRVGKTITFATSHHDGNVKEGNKTGKVVVVALLPEIEELLDEHRKSLMKSKHPGVSTGLVFPARVRDADEAKHNGYLSRRWFQRCLTRCCEAAEIRRITSHDFRSTFITAVYNAGAQQTVVRSVTTHSTDRVEANYFVGNVEATKALTAPIVAAMVNER